MRKTRTLLQNSARCVCQLEVCSSGPPNDSQITGHSPVLVLVLVLVRNTAEMEQLPEKLCGKELLVLPGLVWHMVENIIFKEPVQFLTG